MPASATNTFTSYGLIAIYPEEAHWINVNIAPSLTLARGTVLGELTATNDVQTVTFGGTVSGGTYTLTFNGQTTAAIAYNATAAAVAAAVALLTGVGTGNVTGSGGPGPTAVVLTFTGSLAQAAQSLITTTSSLTGTAPTVTVVHTTTGQAPGVYKAYASGNSDGSQIPKGILEYDVVTDASGNATFGLAGGGGQWQQTQKGVPMFVRGDFYTSELVGLDANAVTVFGGRLLEGSLSLGGVFRMP